MKRSCASSNWGAMRPVTESDCVWKVLSRSTRAATSSVIAASNALRDRLGNCARDGERRSGRQREDDVYPARARCFHTGHETEVVEFLFDESRKADD